MNDDDERLKKIWLRLMLPRPALNAGYRLSLVLFGYFAFAPGYCFIVFGNG